MSNINGATSPGDWPQTQFAFSDFEPYLFVPSQFYHADYTFSLFFHTFCSYMENDTVAIVGPQESILAHVIHILRMSSKSLYYPLQSNRPHP
ncbi:hypothetical protein SLA2020_419990 [Shorea laevis]